ncbi:MAG: hypothetical protein NZ528_07625 [Caldilineales bacterium]|nr:hypothetical protein [Caldilineales bacterium]MDW8316761.1 hypothetical protein [Anaerolineae bacterium]
MPYADVIAGHSFEALAADPSRAEDPLETLIAQVNRLATLLLRQYYPDKAYAYFGEFLRHVRVISLQDLEPVLEERLTKGEMRALRQLDLLVQGQLREADKPTDLFLAVEVSAVVDANDVARAQHRATLLRKAGFRAIPVAAGDEATEGAQATARQQAVLLMQDGLTYNWEEALADALAA